METLDLNRQFAQARNRRRFLTGIGIAGVTAIAAPKLAMSRANAASPDAASPTKTDVEVLQFALNLEYLEAQFYAHAALGKALPASLLTGSGTQGGVTGGSKVPFMNANIKVLAEELAEEEMLHVAAIRAALKAYGVTPVAQPEIDFSKSFTTLAKAAGLISGSQTFSPFTSDVNFLLGAYIFEDVGVTAYNGAAQLVSSAILSYATGIMAVEAYHAGAIRMLAYENSLFSQTTKISDLRATLDGTSSTTPDDTGITVSNSSSGDNRIVDRDDNAVAFERNTSQVLSIVYGSQIKSNGDPSASKGLFYPAGLNGAIH